MVTQPVLKHRQHHRQVCILYTYYKVEKNVREKSKRVWKKQKEREGMQKYKHIIIMLRGVVLQVFYTHIYT